MGRRRRSGPSSSQFPTCYGIEFTSNAILHWSKEHRVEWHYIAPGKPMQNGYIDPSTAGCATSFSTKACFSISTRLRKSSTLGFADYNTRRPHSSLGYRTPAAYADHLTAPRQWAYQQPRL